MKSDTGFYDGGDLNYGGFFELIYPNGLSVEFGRNWDDNVVTLSKDGEEHMIVYNHRSPVFWTLGRHIYLDPGYKKIEKLVNEARKTIIHDGVKAMKAYYKQSEKQRLEEVRQAGEVNASKIMQRLGLNNIGR